MLTEHDLAPEPFLSGALRFAACDWDEDNFELRRDAAQLRIEQAIVSLGALVDRLRQLPV